MFEILSHSPIFIGMKPNDIDALLQLYNHQVRSYKSGQTIVQNGDVCDNLFIVVEGSVKGEMIDYSGKIIKIEDIFAPRPLALGFIFGKNNRFPVDVVANSNCRLLLIPKRTFILLLQSNEVILKNFLNAISNRTQFLSNKIKFLAFKTIKGKIAHYILELAKGKKDTITLPKTQVELAEFFGVTRPSLARAIGEMVSGGLIETNKKEIIIIDKARLIQLIQ